MPIVNNLVKYKDVIHTIEKIIHPSNEKDRWEKTLYALEGVEQPVNSLECRKYFTDGDPTHVTYMGKLHKIQGYHAKDNVKTHYLLKDVVDLVPIEKCER